MTLTRGQLPRLLTATALAAVALLAACQGDSSPKPPDGAGTGPLPVLRARMVTTPADPGAADPLADPLWKSATWTALTAPLSSAETKAPPPAQPTRVAPLYDASKLYVAFVCTTNPGAADQGRAEVWLDTSERQDGTEVFAILATPAGKATCNWYRTSSPPKAREDGSPNYALPIMEIPNYQVAGLAVKTGTGTADGQPAWTAVFAIPLKALPLPLRPHEVRQGVQWRVNLLRCDPAETGGGDKVRQVRQANLSPIYQGSQQVSPYRMAALVLDGNSSSAVAEGSVRK